MALSGEMIQFRWLNLGNNATESRAVVKIAIVEKEAASTDFLIPSKMLDARSQQVASAPHDAMHRIPLFQKQLAQIGAVLAGDPGNQRDFVGILHTLTSYLPHLHAYGLYVGIITHQKGRARQPFGVELTEHREASSQ